MKINGKEFLTINEMSIKSGKETNTIKQWLFTHKIKPVSKDALYNVEVLKMLLAAKTPGRPPKNPKKDKKQPV